MANNQVVVYLLLNAAQYNAAMAQAAGQTQNLGKTASAAGGQAASGLSQASSASNGLLGVLTKVLSTAALMAVRFAGMYVAVGALKSVVGAGIDEFVKLDTNLRNIQSITLDSDKSIDKLRHTLLNSVIAGDTFGRSASELSDGMYELVSAGYTTDEALTLVKIAAMGAAAGLSNTATVSKLLLGILQAYKIPVSGAAEVMDQLFVIVDLGVIHFDQLAGTMGLLIPSAAALKIPLNELGAAIELLTRQGQQPSRVMTNLADVMSKMLKPNTALAAAIKELGFNSGEAMVKTLGFVESVRRLSVLSGGSDAALAKWFSDIRAIRAILPLAADEGRDFTEMLAEHNAEVEKGGRTAKALAEQQKSMSYQWSVLSSKLRALVGLTVGELTPAVVNLLGTINNFIQTLEHVVGMVTTSSDAMTVLKGVVISLLAVSLLPRLVALFNSWGLSLLLSNAGTRLLTAASGDLAGAFVGLGAAIQRIALIGFLTALYIAFTKLSNISPVQSAIDGMKKSLDDLDDTLRSGSEALGKGLMSKEAYGIFAEQAVFDSIVGNIKRLHDGIDALQNMSLTDNIGKFFNDAKQGFLWLTGGIFGQADLRTNFQKIRDEWTNTFDESLKKLGDNKKGVQALEQSVRELVAQKKQELDVQTEQLSHQKSISQEDMKRLSANKAVLQVLIESDAAAFRQLASIEKSERAHRAAAVAAKETTEQIQTANDRVSDMANNATKWADNLKPVEEAVKKIAGLLTPQKAAAEANIAAIELQIAEYEHLHKVSKAAIDAQIDGIEKEKMARKLNNDTMDAAIKQQERHLDKTKELVTAYDKTIASLEKQKDAFKTPMNDRLKDLNEQLAILKATQQVMEDRHENTSGIKKQIADLEKQINVQSLGALKEDQQHRKADKAIDDQIKKQKELKEKAEETVKQEEARIKKLKEQYDQEKENARLEDDKAAQRIDDLKNMKNAQDPVLQSMKDQLEAAKETESLEAARLKSLQAQAIAAAMTSLKEQGMTVDLNEQKFLLEAIPAIMMGNVGAVQTLADKYGVSTARADELLGKALTLGHTEGTPKFDANAPKPLADATGNVFTQMLTINRTPVKVKVDDGQIDSLVGKIGRLAATLSKGFKATVHWVVDHLPHNAMGGIYSKHMVTEIAEDDKPEAVIPLTNPSRARAIMSALDPNVLSKIMPSGRASGMGMSGGDGGGARSFAIKSAGSGDGNVRLADQINITTGGSADEIVQKLYRSVDELGGQLRAREQRRGSVLNGRLM
jgi:TP901 family phage tail tape measure protein